MTPKEITDLVVKIAGKRFVWLTRRERELIMKLLREERSRLEVESMD